MDFYTPADNTPWRELSDETQLSERLRELEEEMYEERLLEFSTERGHRRVQRLADELRRKNPDLSPGSAYLRAARSLYPKPPQREQTGPQLTDEAVRLRMAAKGIDYAEAVRELGREGFVLGEE